MNTTLKRMTLLCAMLAAAAALFYGLSADRYQLALQQEEKQARQRDNPFPSIGELRSMARKTRMICNGPQMRDHRWRWYTASYPSPDQSWKLYAIDGKLCHGSDQHWLAFPINAKELKRYGCVAQRTGLYCKPDANPQKHPKAEELIG